MSFFDDGGEDTEATRRRPARPAAARPRPRPRRPAGGGAGGEHPADHQTIMVRRGVAFGVGLILLFVIVLGISSCESNAHRDALSAYNDNVAQIARDSDQNVGASLFDTLGSAQGKSAATLSPQIDQLRSQAANDVSRARALSVPGEMAGAQRDLVLALDLREEAVADIANRLPSALGTSSAGPAFAAIAGDMGLAYTSDNLFAARVTPLIAQELGKAGIHDEQAASSRWVHDLNWLFTDTVSARLTGVSGTGANGGPLAPGTHGHALTGVTVGSTTLSPSPSVNNISGGTNPTFTVAFDNTGQNAQSNVKVDVSVTAQGQTRSGSATQRVTQPGQSYTINVPVKGVPLQVPAKISVEVEPVPGETNDANNKQTYTALFGP